MKRFSIGVIVYIALCLAAMVVIVVRGDGPHPRVIALYPPNGDRFFPGGAVQITFSQPMNESSVERALQVSPGTQGQGQWYGTTLNVQPVGDWQSNVTYHVALSGSVTDVEGRPLHTPFTYWFRVHHVGRLTLCRVHGIRTVCEWSSAHPRPLFLPPTSIDGYALSEDGSTVAYTRPDASGLPHLFLIAVDGTQSVQLTHGRLYADSAPYWSAGDSTSVTYDRRRVWWRDDRPHYDRPRLWNIGVDGSNNAPLG